MRRSLLFLVLFMGCAAVAGAQFNPGGPSPIDPATAWEDCIKIDYLGPTFASQLWFRLSNSCAGLSTFDLSYVAWIDNELTGQGIIPPDPVVDFYVPFGTQPPAPDSMIRIVFYGTLVMPAFGINEKVWELETWVASDYSGSPGTPGGPGGPIVPRPR